MSDTTKYRVESEFAVTGNAEKALKDISHHAKEAAEHAESLKEGLKMVAEAIGLRELITKAGEAFIGFNAQVEQTKIKLAAMVGANFKADWKQATKASDELYESFQKFEEIAPVDAREMAGFAEQVSAAVTGAGGSIKDITEVATKGALAVKVFGGNAMQLNRMLAGHVSDRQILGKTLLNSMGLNSQQWKALTGTQRLHKMEGAFDSETMKGAASSLTTSFTGAVAMLKNTIEDTLGKVGLPLFQSITKEIVSWNKWIQMNPEKIQSIMDSMSNGIKEAMSIVGNVISSVMPILREAMSAIGAVMNFVSEHRSVIEGVVKGLLIYKGIGLAGGAVGGIGSGISGIGKMFGDIANNLKGVVGALGGAEGGASITGLFGSLGGALTSLISAAGPIALFGTALYGLAGIMFKETQTEKEQRENSEKAKHTSDEWMNRHDEYKELLKRKADSGITDDDKYGGINAKLKDIDRSKDALIDAAIKNGMVSETISGGVRHLELIKSGGSRLLDTGKGDFDPSAYASMRKSLTTLFSEAAEDARRGNGTGKDGLPSDARFDAKHFEGFYDQSVHDAEVEKKAEELVARTPVNQTVNVTIQQVSAKDPDRWLADIDDMAARSINSPRRTKSSLATRIGGGNR